MIEDHEDPRDFPRKDYGQGEAAGEVAAEPRQGPGEDAARAVLARAPGRSAWRP